MTEQTGDNSGEGSAAATLSPRAEARLAAATAAREQRLARALRENLKRRKAQGRGRAVQGSGADDGSTSGIDI